MLWNAVVFSLHTACIDIVVLHIHTASFGWQIWATWNMQSSTAKIKETRRPILSSISWLLSEIGSSKMGTFCIQITTVNVFNFESFVKCSTHKTVGNICKFISYVSACSYQKILLWNIDESQPNRMALGEKKVDWIFFPNIRFHCCTIANQCLWIRLIITNWFMGKTKPRPHEQ